MDTYFSHTLTGTGQTKRLPYANVDTKYKRLHSELLTLSGGHELHGNKLGLAGIEKIAKRLAHIIREKGLHFLFGRVDKKFLAATKMFDLAFDSGANDAMPAHAYGVQQLRLINTMHFVQMLEEADLIEFWDLFKKQDAVRFGKLLGIIEARVGSTPYDARSKQILGEALAWGSANPEKILDPYGEKDSPNVVAFIGLFGHLHRLHSDRGDIIGSFVHDEQNQFMKHFEEMWELVSKWKFLDGPLSIISDIEAIDSFDTKLIAKSSSDSFGLQIVDVCLWLVKKAIDSDAELSGDCARLADCILQNSWLTRFDFGNVAAQVEAGSKVVYDLPLSDAQLENGRKIRDEIEANRQKRLANKSSLAASV